MRATLEITERGLSQSSEYFLIRITFDFFDFRWIFWNSKTANMNDSIQLFTNFYLSNALIIL